MLNRIAFVIPSAAGGGAERVAILLANRFAEDGIDTDLVIGRLEGPNLDLISSRVRIVDLKSSKFQFALIKLNKYLRQNKPDVIFSRMRHTISITELALSGVLPRPFHVGSVHGMLETEFPIISFQNKVKRRITKILELHAFKRIDHLISVSHAVNNQHRLIYRIPNSKTSVIYNPIETHNIQRQANEGADHLWLANKKLPIVLAVGRLVPEKGFDILINSFKQVHEELGARLIILGEGPRREELEDLRDRLSLQGIIDMPGYIKNPFSYMKKSDLLVSSSRREGLGNVLLESLAIGTPVVATDCPGGPKEVLKNGQWGILVPSEDPLALADGIIQGLSQEVNPSCLESYAANFDIENVFQKYLALAKTRANST